MNNKPLNTVPDGCISSYWYVLKLSIFLKPAPWTFASIIINRIIIIGIIVITKIDITKINISGIKFLSQMMTDDNDL